MRSTYLLATFAASLLCPTDTRSLPLPDQAFHSLHPDHPL